MNDIYLQHHGIKGQRWGKRNGPPYPLDESNHSSSEKKAGWKRSLKNNNNSSTTTNRIRNISKVLLVAGGVTAAGVIGYNVYKHGMQSADSILRAGSVIQRVEGGKGNFVVPSRFYGATNKMDKTIYRGQFGGIQVKNKGKAYIKDIKTNYDLKIAGSNTGRSIFTNLYKTDNDFKQYVDSMANTNKLWKKGRKHNTVRYEGDLKRLYENFNINSVMDEHRNNEQVNKFFNALKSKNYNGLQDINDQKFSSFKANKPVIYFDMDGKAAVDKIKDLPYSQISIDHGRVVTNKILASSTSKIAIASIGVGTIGVAGSSTTRKKRRKRKNKEK